MVDKIYFEEALDGLNAAIAYIEQVLGSDAAESETLDYIREKRDAVWTYWGNLK